MPTSDEKKRDEALKRALAMPPTPHKPLGKKSVGKQKPAPASRSKSEQGKKKRDQSD